VLFFSILWSVAEGISSVYFGLMYQNLSLLMFGLNSAIELASECVMSLHILCEPSPGNRSVSSHTPLNSQPKQSTLFTPETERRLTIFVGVLLVLFGISSIIGGAWRLYHHEPPDSTFWGMVLGAVCTAVMFVVYCLKTKAAVILNSPALMMDASCTLADTKVSAILLFGSLVYEGVPYFFGSQWDHRLWWIDAAMTIIIGLLVGWEGIEEIKEANDTESQDGSEDCSVAEWGMTNWLKKRFEKQLQQRTGKLSGIEESPRPRSTEGGIDVTVPNSKNSN